MSPNRSITPGQHSRVSIVPQPRSEASAADTTSVRPPAVTAAEPVATGARMLVVVWCCSVGTTWTVELHEPGPGAILGTLVDWISSGVPTSQPQPDEPLAHKLLADYGLHLYPDSAAGPCTHSRSSIGYVSGDP